MQLVILPRPNINSFFFFFFFFFFSFIILPPFRSPFRIPIITVHSSLIKLRMVVAPSPAPRRSSFRKTARPAGIPIVDLSLDRSVLADKIVRACQEYGVFKVTNHGVPDDLISGLEKEAAGFFSKPAFQKQQAGPPNPFGYGYKNIGFNGDKGEFEYLLLHTDPLSISHRSNAISDDPSKFSCVVNDYIKAVRELGCEILELMAEGLWLRDRGVFSRLITDVLSDSCFRLNHYPPLDHSKQRELDPCTSNSRMGFGEHSDPQILTILRSNDVSGLQICLDGGFWAPVPPDPSEFCIFVGDALQAMTNGRFVSARHRVVVTGSEKPRMSMMYFGAPALDACISPLPEMVSAQKPCLYKPFTWSEFKKAAYSLRLGDCRLNLFKTDATAPSF